MYIDNKKILREVIAFEQSQYRKLAFHSKKEYIWAKLFHNPTILIMKWQKYSRIADYYAHACMREYSIRNLVCSKYYEFLRYKYANKCGFEIYTSNIGRGFMVYHIGATVINPDTIIGDNVHLHGNNCIGNGGDYNFACPIIGNNVKVGVGAKIIGGIKIGDDCYIGACALVNKSFEVGQILIGVPAKALCKDE